MRKMSLLASAGLFALPVVAQAMPLNELLADKGAAPAPAHVYYQNGTRLEFPDAGFDMKLNVQLQALYTYTDLKGGPDTNDFGVKNARLELSGHLLNKEFSYKLQNDFTTSGDTNTGVQDAWFEWNSCDAVNVRFGQFKTPFGRQWLNNDYALEFIDRSKVTRDMTFAREGGVEFNGTVGDLGYHYLALMNGNSVINGRAEGTNVPGIDPNMIGVYHIGLSLVGDYDRSYEGDPKNTQDFALGMGAGAYYGNGHVQSALIEILDATQSYGASADLGARYMGWSGQAEFLYNGMRFDEKVGALDIKSEDMYGLYVQTGYFFVPKEWEIAARWGGSQVSKNAAQTFGIAKDQSEVSVVLGYYLNGHNLKILTGPTWQTRKEYTGEGDSTKNYTDFLYQVGFFGYF